MKKLKTYAGLIFAFGGLILSGCAVFPDAQAAPDLDPIEENEQDFLVNKIFDTKYLDAMIDVNVKYQSEDMETPDNYHVTGDAYLDISSLDNVGADVWLELDMNNSPSGDLPKIDFDFIYTDNTVYLDINDRAVKLETNKFSELLELLLGSGNEDEAIDPTDKTNITNSGIKDIVMNIANMTVTNEGDYYKYVSKTTGDQPDLVLTSDLDYNLTSLTIAGIKYQDFTIDVKIDTRILPSLTNPIVSPESEGHPYIDLTNYFGIFRKLRSIIDDEKFGLQYELALTHYEVDKDTGIPNPSIYLGDTTGHLNMDLKDTILRLNGDLNVNDLRTNNHQAYVTKYDAEYFNECIYFDYFLKNDQHLKLSYTNKGLNDMWDLLGDSELFGGKNIFDMIFGTSSKEYPILDILTDATYRNISKYGSINVANNYIEVDIDNYLFGGKGHGSIKINLNDDEQRTIKDITITSLDINSYVVDGKLSFEDYQTITPVNPQDYNLLDGIDGVIRNGVEYFRSNKYNLGLDVTVKDMKSLDPENPKTLTIEGDAQFNIRNNIVAKKTAYDGYADLTINDFDNSSHHLEMNANPVTIEGDKEEDVYVKYGYTAPSSTDEVELKLKATRDSISTIFDEITGYNPDASGDGGSVDIYKMILPYIGEATNDALKRILNEGDYFAALRYEMISKVSIQNGLYVVQLDKGAFGLRKDLVVSVKLDTSGEEAKITYIELSTQYNRYDIHAKVYLKNNDAEIPTWTDSQKAGCIPLDAFTNIIVNKEAHLDLNAEVLKIVDNTPQEYISVESCQIDLKINNKQNKDDQIWDRLYAKISGNVETSGDTAPTAFVLGYDSNLSFKFGETAKVVVSRENVRNIIDRAKQVLPVSKAVNDYVVPVETDSNTEANIEGNINMFLQVMDILGEGSYNKFLSKIKSTSLVNSNKLQIVIDNSMFRENDTTEGTITINFNSAGITSIELGNVRYANYALTGSLSIVNRTRTDVVIDNTYNRVYNVIDAVLNVATEKDIVLSGDIKIDPKLLDSLGLNMYREFSYSAFIHKENDAHNNESVYGYFRFDDVPFIYWAPTPWQDENNPATYRISDTRDVFKNGQRIFEIYFSSIVNYDEDGHTISEGDTEVTRTNTIALKAGYNWDGNTKIKEKFITSEDFMGDMTYYILNYGLGIKARNGDLPDTSKYYGEENFDDPSLKDNDWLNFHNYNVDSNYTPNLSKLLESYSYYEPTELEPSYHYESSIYSDMTADTTSNSWVIKINGSTLINNDSIGSIELFTTTGSDEKGTYLSSAIITTKIEVAGIASARVGMTLNYNRGATPPATGAKSIAYVKQYLGSHDIGYRNYTVVPTA